MKDALNCARYLWHEAGEMQEVFLQGPSRMGLKVIILLT